MAYLLTDQHVSVLRAESIASLRPRVGYVYFAAWSESSPIKIGFTVDDEKRLSGLQTGLPYRVFFLGVAPGTVDDERNLHRRLVAHRLEREWFDRHEDVERVMAEFLRSRGRRRGRVVALGG